MIVTIWSWPIATARRVYSTNAATSEPEEVLAVAEPDDERRVAARADDDAGLVLVHGEQGEGAVAGGRRPAAGCGEVAGLVVLAAEQQAATSVSVSLVEGGAVGEQLVLAVRRSSR